MGARSKRLCGPVVLGPELELVYAVPEGKTALVKWIRLVVFGDAGAFSLVIGFGGTPTLETAIHHQTTLPHQTVLTDSDQVVLNAGEALWASYSVSSSATLIISGAELIT